MFKNFFVYFLINRNRIKVCCSVQNKNEDTDRKSNRKVASRNFYIYKKCQYANWVLPIYITKETIRLKKNKKTTNNHIAYNKKYLLQNNKTYDWRKSNMHPVRNNLTY